MLNIKVRVTLTSISFDLPIEAMINFAGLKIAEIKTPIASNCRAVEAMTYWFPNNKKMISFGSDPLNFRSYCI